MSKLGKCNSCGAKIGRKTINGVFRYDSSMRQIGIKYKYFDESGSHRADTTLHVPVCVKCAQDPNLDKITKDNLKMIQENGNWHSYEIENFFEQKP